jgi:signal transduction histidine kinase
VSIPGTSSTAAEQLETLDVATRAIAGIVDLEVALQLVVDRVRELVGARYAALGIAGPDGLIQRFITSGISLEQRAAIGALPRGRGLLGLIIREGRTFRVADIASHPDSSGFPLNHPPMHSFLGVPVTAHSRPIGNFYLTDREGGLPFTEEDQRLVERFALHAGIAIENARLHAQVGQLAVVQERDRIGRDLHDGIIQSLYGVGLSLEDVPDLMADAPGEASERVDRAIEAINLAIRDIRNFIYGLRPEAVDGSNVLAGLAALTEEVQRQSVIDVDVELDLDVRLGLDDEAGRHVLQLAREALSNAARHGGAGRITVRLTADDDGSPRLQIADDGSGFDPAFARRPGHHGLENMAARAEALRGQLTIDSLPGAGTRIILVLPSPDGQTDEGP